MSILVNKNTKVIVQGLTGRAGRFHAQQCVSYGTQIVGGVTPGKGDTSVDEIPVFDTVENAMSEFLIFRWKYYKNRAPHQRDYRKSYNSVSCLIILKS